MNLKQRYNLWKAQKAMSPDRTFKIALWRKLDSRLRENNSLSWYQAVWFRRATVSAVIILLVATLSTGAYAYNSPEVTEGTPLYTVKQQLEKIEEKVSVTPEAKAKFYLKEIKRREQEAEILQKRGVNLDKKLDKVEQQIEQVENKLEKTDVALDKIKTNPKVRVEVKERLEKRADLKKQRLQKRTEQLKKFQDKLEGLKNN